MNAKEIKIAAARIIAVSLALMSWALAGCSAITVYQQSGTASAGTDIATAATEDGTLAALDVARDAAQATAGTLATGAAEAVLTIAALSSPATVDPTEADPASSLPSSAEITVFGSVPIDSDRLNIIAALAFDADGQLLAATRAGEIYALPDSDGDGRADETRLIFADDEQALRQVSGLIARGDGLILLNGERLSLLRDSDGDGVYESVTQLAEGLPAGQGPLQASNGMVESPDGRLFTVDISAGEILRIVLRE